MLDELRSEQRICDISVMLAIDITLMQQAHITFWAVKTDL